MKRIRSILRSRGGMTLVELVVGAGLLCLVIGVFSASLRPAAEVSRRTQELNNAELIADDLLETVRSKAHPPSLEMLQRARSNRRGKHRQHQIRRSSAGATRASYHGTRSSLRCRYTLTGFSCYPR